MRLQDVRFKSFSAGLMGAGLLGVMLGTCGMVKAQEPARDDARQEQPKQVEAKPEARPGSAKPQQDEAKPPKEQAPAKAEEAKPSKNDKQDQKQSGEMRGAQDHPMQNNGGDHAMRASGRGGQKIPDDKFRAQFGRQHTFRVQTTVVQGQPRFQYGGYWFSLANPWPGDWAYTDECYIDYINGEYVLIDLLHPGVEIPVIVVVG
ncbi:MAG: hypothetical protein WBV69_21475 [Candidatus Sulfotelmatobacter sp.]